VSGVDLTERLPALEDALGDALARLAAVEGEASAGSQIASNPYKVNAAGEAEQQLPASVESGRVAGTREQGSRAQIFPQATAKANREALQAAINAGATHIQIDQGLASSNVFEINEPVFPNSQRAPVAGKPQASQIEISSTTNTTIRLGANLPTVNGAFGDSATAKWAFFPNTLESAWNEITNVVEVTEATAVNGATLQPAAATFVIRNATLDGGNAAKANEAGWIFANRAPGCGIRECAIRNTKYGMSWVGYCDQMFATGNQLEQHGEANTVGPEENGVKMCWLVYQQTNGDGIRVNNNECGSYYGTWHAKYCLAGEHIGNVHGQAVFKHCSAIKLDVNHNELTEEHSVTAIRLINSRVVVSNEFWFCSTTAGVHMVEIADEVGPDGSELSLENCHGYLNLVGQGDAARVSDIHIASASKGTQIRTLNSDVAYYDSGGINRENGDSLLITSEVPAITTALESGLATHPQRAITAGRGWELKEQSGGWQVIPIGGVDVCPEQKNPTIAAAALNAGVVGALAEGTTYTYQATAMNDYGGSGSNSPEAEATATASKAVKLTIGVRAAPCVVTVFREEGAGGVEAGATAYCQIPVSGTQPILIDAGTHLNGRPWVTAGVPKPSEGAYKTHSAREMLVLPEGTRIMTGTGNPNETPVTGTPGSLFLQTNGAQGSILWICVEGSKWAKATNRHITTAIEVEAGTAGGVYKTTQAAELVLAPSGSAGLTVELTSPAVKGETVTIKKSDAAAHTVTVKPKSGEIDGKTEVKLESQYQSVTMAWDGTSWQVTSSTTASIIP
jgi:hypothetical protein